MKIISEIYLRRGRNSGPFRFIKVVVWKGDDSGESSEPL